MSISRRVDKQTGHIYTGILLSGKKNEDTYNMNGSQKYAEWKKPYTKEFIQFIWSFRTGKTYLWCKKNRTGGDFEDRIRDWLGWVQVNFLGVLQMFYIFIGIWVTEVGMFGKIHLMVCLRFVLYTIMKCWTPVNDVHADVLMC